MAGLKRPPRIPLWAVLLPIATFVFGLWAGNQLIPPARAGTPTTSTRSVDGVAWDDQPAPVPVKVRLGGHRVVQEGDVVRVAGYLENTGNATATNPRVAVSLLNAAGETVAAGGGIYLRDAVPPGERSPFLSVFRPAPAGWETARVQVQAAPHNPRTTPATARAGPLAVTDSAGRYTNPENTYYVISGQLKNEGSVPVTLPAISAIAYDAAGEPVMAGQGFAKLDPLAPGESAPFSIDLFGAPNIDRYDLYPQARPAS